MNRYGIVICPRCGRAQGVRLNFRTHTCQCGTRIALRNAKVLFSTEEPRELPEALGRVRAELAGDLEKFEEVIEAPRAETAERRPSDAVPNKHPLERPLQILRHLGEEGQGFSLRQAEEALAARGMEASGVIDALVREGLIYESQRGVYRLV